MRDHVHEPAHRDDARAFRGAVNRDQNRAAHGGVTVREHCRCGASRLVNVNGSHVERGPWTQEPASV